MHEEKLLAFVLLERFTRSRKLTKYSSMTSGMMRHISLRDTRASMSFCMCLLRTRRRRALAEPALEIRLSGRGRDFLKQCADRFGDLRGGRLVPVLTDYETPNADIYAVYLQRHQMSTRIRAFVDFMARTFQDDGGA